jgi:hypothetical protein
MPIIRLPINEMLGYHFQSQERTAHHYSCCADLELNAYECLEAYGIIRGGIVCKQLLDDYLECVGAYKSVRRAEEMKKERIRQVATGKRPITQFWGTKMPNDSYVPPPFW